MSEIKKIICDTNIWYHIGNNRLEIPQNSILIATWLSVVELLASHPKNKKDFSKQYQMKAIKAIVEKSNYIITLNPVQYALTLMFPESDINFPNVNLKEILENVLYERVDVDEYSYQKYPFFNTYETFKKHFSKTIKEYCEDVRKEKSEYKKMANDEKLKIRYLELIQDINDILVDDVEIKDALNNEDFEYTKKIFSLYIESKKIYLDGIINTKTFSEIKWKNKENDFVDLYNLIYSSDGMYYWTQDGKSYNRCKETKYPNIIDWQELHK